MRLKEIAAGRSLFEIEANRVGRPLDRLDKALVVARYSAILVAIPTIPILAGDYRDNLQKFPHPTQVIFNDIELRLGGGGKALPTIMLTERGRTRLISPCEGLMETVCRQEGVSRNPISAGVAEAIELRPGVGVITRIEFTPPGGASLSVTNPAAERLVVEASRPWHHSHRFSLLLVGTTTIAYLLLKTLSLIRAQRRTDSQNRRA